ncbi:hypothetical protein [Streptomyces qinglanensis]
MLDPLQSVVQQTRAAALVACCTTDVINGTGVTVRPMGARAICAELEN